MIWGGFSSLCVHTSALGIENCVEVLILDTHGYVLFWFPVLV